MNEFNLEELKEIEKIFDIMAGNVSKQHAELIGVYMEVINKSQLPKNTADAEIHLSKLFDEFVNTFDRYRTISAKCNRLIKKMCREELKEATASCNSESDDSKLNKEVER